MHLVGPIGIRHDRLVTKETRLALVETVHTAIWLSVESALVYFLYTG
jgi:hypothetical protein